MTNESIDLRQMCEFEIFGNGESYGVEYWQAAIANVAENLRYESEDIDSPQQQSDVRLLCILCHEMNAAFANIVNMSHSWTYVVAHERTNNELESLYGDSFIRDPGEEGVQEPNGHMDLDGMFARVYLDYGGYMPDDALGFSIMYLDTMIENVLTSVSNEGYADGTKYLYKEGEFWHLLKPRLEDMLQQAKEIVHTILEIEGKEYYESEYENVS